MNLRLTSERTQRDRYLAVVLALLAVVVGANHVFSHYYVPHRDAIVGETAELEWELHRLREAQANAASIEARHAAIVSGPKDEGEPDNSGTLERLERLAMGNVRLLQVYPSGTQRDDEGAQRAPIKLSITFVDDKGSLDRFLGLIASDLGAQITDFRAEAPREGLGIRCEMTIALPAGDVH